MNSFRHIVYNSRLPLTVEFLKNMAGYQMSTHPVNGFKGKGTKDSLRNMPHYCMPGLNISLTNTIDSSEEAIQYYSAPDRFSLPVPYVEFSETNSSNINFIWSIAFRI